MKNYYEILQVNYDATQAEIKEAYHRQLLKSLPSNHFIDFDQKENNFEDVQESYEVLSDERKRRAYDQLLHSSTSRAQDEGAPVHTPFNSLLEALSQSRSNDGFRRINNLGVPVVLILFLAATGLAVWYTYSSNTSMSEGPESETVMTTGTSHLLVNQPAVLESSLGEANRGHTHEESLKTYLALIADSATSFKEKTLAIQDVLPLFENANSHIVVIGLHDTPVRTQAVHEYLDFLLLNGPRVVVKSLDQNEKGKITRLEVSEHYDDGL